MDYTMQSQFKKAQRIGKCSIKKRKERSETLGFKTPKYVEFIEFFFKKGFEIRLYESKSTRSKYVYISKENRFYKVRFSNHKPSKNRELENDCHFFVGISNFGITTTQDAIKATLQHFESTLNKGDITSKEGVYDL